MRLFLDNVLIHRLDAVFGGNASQAPIRSTDAVALLNFAEHILFADKLLVPSFEPPEVWEISQKTLSALQSTGCTDLGSECSLIEVAHVTEDTYANACLAACPRATQILSLEFEHLERCARLADHTAIPSTFDYSLPEKWLKSGWSPAQRERLRTEALAPLSRGAVDLMLASDSALYERVRQIANRTQSNKRRRQIAPVIQIACFVALNEQLARRHDAIYAPAPQRSRVIHRADTIFRQSLEQTIRAVIQESGHRIQTNPLLEVGVADGAVLPVPMLALHYLRHERISNSIQLLEAARRLRETRDVSELRVWLGKFEEDFTSPDLKARQRALRKLRDIQQELGKELRDEAMYSVFQPKIGINALHEVSIDPDFAGAVESIRRFWRSLFSPEVSLLSDLSREFSLDSDIGSDIIRMLGRAIVNEPKR